MAPGTSGFETNVFINCPFDVAYQPLLRALLFVVIDCGFEPRIALENPDSGAVRVEKIKNLIQASQYSIHDLSRMEALNVGEFPRFNMPFELGLDLGCRDFGTAELKTKKCLILEKDQYRYRQVLSDISGNDIQAHNDDPQTLVRRVRNWFYNQRSQARAPIQSGTMAWQRFNEFYGNFGLATQAAGYHEDDLIEMPVTEFIAFIKRWREDHPVRYVGTR
jgi:hypothetical protein